MPSSVVVLRQRIEGSSPTPPGYRQHAEFPFERDEALRDQPGPELLDRGLRLTPRTHHHLALSVVTEPARLDHRRKPRYGHRLLHVFGSVDRVERRGGDPQLAEHPFLGEAVLGDVECAGGRQRGETRGQVGGALGRDVLELVRHHVRSRCHLGKPVRVVVRGGHHRARHPGGRVGRPLQNREAVPQGDSLESEHAGELPTAQYPDPHRGGGMLGSRSARTASLRARA